MKNMHRHWFWLAACILVLSGLLARADTFRSQWPDDVERIWTGKSYWTNRLQDWRLRDGRLHCTIAAPNRETALLTHRISGDGNGFTAEVRLQMGEADGWAGFCVGARGRLAQWPDLADYRDNAVRGNGLQAGLTADGTLFVGNPGSDTSKDDVESDGPVLLRLEARSSDNGPRLTLRAIDPKNDEEMATVSRNVNRNALVGAVKLKAHKARTAFDDWTLSGEAVQENQNRTFGPILWSQYTLSEDTLKMTAQMPPMGEADSDRVTLQVKKNGSWNTLQSKPIHDRARTATFKVKSWDDSSSVPYRLAYTYIGRGGEEQTDHWNGTIRRNPTDKNTIKVAGFTGCADYAWPNADLVKHVKAADPDVLFFSGDNVYEQVNGYGVQRSPLDKACLDYLRKWYFFGWAFRDLLRDRPAVIIPDDHDVYQGNIFGESGKHAEGGWIDGGYTMPPEWVNMVEHTQTAHLPDPADPEPVKQGIGVYFTSMNYGRISFAILEDRKFKTGPQGILPDDVVDRADHVTDPDWNPEIADVDRAQLLGQRQLDFLDEWAADWANADMKMALSQTVFANAATHHGGNLNYLVADLDSNGWPQTGRNKAVRRLRKAFAFHLCGDQHLATLIHHGVNEWGDAMWSMAVPSVANLYMRAWRPKYPGIPVGADMPGYTGKFRDPFDHPITVWATTNPGDTSHDPGWLFDKKPGWGLVKMHRESQQITVECWPRWADPTAPDASQFDGWPKTISMRSNYGRNPAGYLPTIEVSGMEDPVVQVIHQGDDEIVYTRRVKGTSFTPRIFEPGTYTVRVGNQATGQMKAVEDLAPSTPGQEKTITVNF